MDCVQAFFNFLSVSAVAMAVSNSGGDAVLQTIQVMAAHFVILPLTICSGAETSGAHFNPVVTACFVLVGKIVSLSSSSAEALCVKHTDMCDLLDTHLARLVG